MQGKIVTFFGWGRGGRGRKRAERAEQAQGVSPPYSPPLVNYDVEFFFISAFLCLELEGCMIDVEPFF